MKLHKYYLLPRSNYNGDYESKNGNYMVKTGTVADLIKDSTMFGVINYKMETPTLDVLNETLSSGRWPQKAKWEPFTVDKAEYEEFKQKLIEFRLNASDEDKKEYNCTKYGRHVWSEMNSNEYYITDDKIFVLDENKYLIKRIELRKMEGVSFRKNAMSFYDMRFEEGHMWIYIDIKGYYGRKVILDEETLELGEWSGWM
ncbi:MAG: hypothetical protein IJA01_06550 [Firmicutes bacterium]|nr:hypothetical protein [Bacillota bacterium]